MARDAAFWMWYAEANDSVRHEVIERGWFGRATTQNINAQDMPGMDPFQGADAPEAERFDGTVWDQAGQADIYGPDQEPAETAIDQPDQEQEQ